MHTHRLLISITVYTHAPPPPPPPSPPQKQARNVKERRPGNNSRQHTKNSSWSFRNAVCDAQTPTIPNLCPIRREGEIKGTPQADIEHPTKNEKVPKSTTSKPRAHHHQPLSHSIPSQPPKHLRITQKPPPRTSNSTKHRHHIHHNQHQRRHHEPRAEDAVQH